MNNDDMRKYLNLFESESNNQENVFSYKSRVRAKQDDDRPTKLSNILDTWFNLNR